LSRVGRIILLLVLTVGTIGCDRVTKHIAKATLEGASDRSFLADTIRLQYAENTGGFLSLGTNLSPRVRTDIFSVGAGLLLFIASIAAVKLRLTGGELVGISLALAGGVSNLADRILHGAVVDFLNVGFGSFRTGIFNVADVAVLLGVCIAVFKRKI